MGQLDIVSILVAEATVLVPLTAFFLAMRFSIRKLEDGFRATQAQDGDTAKVLQDVTASLANLNRDHIAIMERHASAARRADKSIEVLDRINQQLAALATDHARVMDSIRFSEKTVTDRLDRIDRSMQQAAS